MKLTGFTETACLLSSWPFQKCVALPTKNLCFDLNQDGYVGLSLKDYLNIAEHHCDTEKADAIERKKMTDSFTKVSYFKQ